MVEPVRPTRQGFVRGLDVARATTSHAMCEMENVTINRSVTFLNLCAPRKTHAIVSANKLPPTGDNYLSVSKQILWKWSIVLG